ncbi:MAG: hypothetical protein ACL93V_03705 [Candidatus Electrothrix sp. YB6]
MNGQRPPKQGIKTVRHPNHDELARQRGCSDIRGLELQAKYIGCQPVNGEKNTFLLEFWHETG